jgi:Domain of unknown function (DUF6894)
MLHCEVSSRSCAGISVKTAWDQAFRGCSHRRERGFCENGALPAPDKELVRRVASGCVAADGARFAPMPRYFFNTRIGDELISDPDGEELRDPDRAWEMASAMIRELLRTEGTDGALLNAIIEVTDDEGEIVLEFPFSEAILLDSPITKH